jgi:hypothetical protein
MLCLVSLPPSCHITWVFLLVIPKFPLFSPLGRHNRAVRLCQLCVVQLFKLVKHKASRFEKHVKVWVMMNWWCHNDDLFTMRRIICTLSYTLFIFMDLFLYMRRLIVFKLQYLNFKSCMNKSGEILRCDTQDDPVGIENGRVAWPLPLATTNAFNQNSCTADLEFLCPPLHEGRGLPGHQGGGSRRPPAAHTQTPWSGPQGRDAHLRQHAVIGGRGRRDGDLVHKPAWLRSRRLLAISPAFVLFRYFDLFVKLFLTIDRENNYFQIWPMVPRRRGWRASWSSARHGSWRGKNRKHAKTSGADMLRPFHRNTRYSGTSRR